MKARALMIGVSVITWLFWKRQQGINDCRKIAEELVRMYKLENPNDDLKDIRITIVKRRK